MASNRDKLALRWITILYLLSNAILWVNVDPPIRLEFAGDGGTWYPRSVDLYNAGTFPDPSNAEASTTYRPPGFPAFAASLFTLFGGPSAGAIAFGQILLLLATGLIFRNTVNDWLPGWGSAGMALLIFNPNVFTIAQYTQSDTLFLFFVTAAVWAVLRFARGDTRLRYPLLVGAALALACLTRATAQFLVLVLPIAFAFIDFANGRVKEIPKSLLKGTLAAALALTLLTPWANYVRQFEGTWDLSSSEVKSRYIWDQITILDAQQIGISYHSAGTGQASRLEAVRSRYGDEWEGMSATSRHAAILSEGYRVLLSYPVSSLLTAYQRSIFQFFTAGGSGRWHYLLVEDSSVLADTWFKTAQDNLGEMIRKFFQDGSGLAILVTAVCLAFVGVARVVGLIGIASIARQRLWSLLLVICALLTYFALVHLFVGNSRYRISVEPLLMIIFLFGIQAIWARFKNQNDKKSI